MEKILEISITENHIDAIITLPIISLLSLAAY